MNMERISTGVERLDLLLGGGIPPGVQVLLHGPRFTGKTALASSFLTRGAAAGIPGVVLHTTRSAGHVRETLVRREPHAEDWLQSGHLQRVDAYTRLIGGAESEPHTEYVDSPVDLNGIASALNNAQRRLQEEHTTHLLVIDSISTLIAHSDAQAAFRFLQVVLGRARNAGSTAMLLMDAGMHSKEHVEMFRHIADGAFDTRTAEGKNQMHVRGFETSSQLGWVDYRVLRERFELTGSFAAGRIR